MNKDLALSFALKNKTV